MIKQHTQLTLQLYYINDNYYIDKDVPVKLIMDTNQLGVRILTLQSNSGKQYLFKVHKLYSLFSTKSSKIKGIILKRY